MTARTVLQPLLLSVAWALASCDRDGGGLDLDVLLSDAGTGGADAGDALDAGEQVDGGEQRVGCDPPTSEQLVDPRTTETACVIDRWLAELPGTPSNLQYRRVKDAVDDASLASNFPLRTGTRVIFVAEVVAGETPALIGEFNAWDPTAGAMQPLAQSGFAYREERLDARAHGYAFVYGHGTAEARTVADAAARWLVPTGTDDGFRSLAIVASPVLATGLIRWVPRFPGVGLGGTRDLFVWFPNTAFGSTARLPVAYAYDGRQLLTRARADLALAERVEAGGAPLLGLFVDVPAAQRRDDYTFGTATSRGDRTARFLADEVVPWVDAHFPTRAEASARAITGASLGGLQALYTAWNHATTFGLVGTQSGSFYWPEPNGEALTLEIAAAERRALRVYLDNGRPNDNETSNEHLASVLAERGYDHRHVQVQGARHDWPDWGARWPGLLAWLFPAD